MKRLDEGKVSLVDFMRSIKFPHHKPRHRSEEVSTHFAHLDPKAPQGDSEDKDNKLVRSAN